MISVLIPTYNYELIALVKSIHKQLTNSSIDFEIICLEDASKKEFVEKNKALANLKNVEVLVNTENLGRNISRQILANKAKFNWLLFLDADVLPKSETYIETYLKYLEKDYDAVFGGFAYHENPPEINSRLRWKFGKKLEQVSANIRNKNPYKVIISANFIIRKTIFIELNKTITTNTYGNDIIFGALLKTRNKKVFHIDNEVYHQGIEDSVSYLQKIETAIVTLSSMLKERSNLKNDNNDLLKAFLKLKKLKLHYPISWFFSLSKNVLKRNLLGKNPSITLLQVYKLGFICSYSLKEKNK